MNTYDLLLFFEVEFEELRLLRRHRFAIDGGLYLTQALHMHEVILNDTIHQFTLIFSRSSTILFDLIMFHILVISFILNNSSN